MAKERISTTTIIQTANNTKSLLFLNLGAVIAFLVSLAANALDSVGAFLGRAPLIGTFLKSGFHFVGSFIRVPCYVVIVIAIVVDILLLLKFLLPFIAKLFRKIFRQKDKGNTEMEDGAAATVENEGKEKTLQVDVKEGEELHLF